MMKLDGIYIRDPFILIDGETYYMYGTTDVQAWGGKASGFNVYVSKDLKNFECKRVFENTDDFWADENFWAPEVHKIGNKYYMFASFFKNGKRRRSQVLVSDSPSGMFKPFDEPLTPDDWECLDCTYFEDNGKKYIIFSHEWTQIKNGEICVSEIDDNFKLIGDIKTLFKASDSPWSRMVNGDCFITDGPFLYRLKSGKILMLWSSIGDKGYAMGMAVSNSVMGEWKHIEKPLIDCNGGHGMIFKDNDKLFITYHQPNEPHEQERAIFNEVKDNGEYIELV